MKYKLIIPVAALALLMACNNGETKSGTGAAEMKAAADDTTGWVSLFDGKTTAGWHSYGKSTAGNSWKVADGVLYLDTINKIGWQTTGGDICTAEEYENFDLKLEWKIAPKGNSGIIFYIHEDTAKYDYVWKTGPEMQVLDNDGHEDGKIIKHHAGDLYDLISCSKETVKPVGEWNQVEIIAVNGKLDFILNGTNVVSTTMWDDNWKKLIAGSKFKDMPDFGTFKKGKIALQDHGCMVSYRNIRIKKL